MTEPSTQAPKHSTLWKPLLLVAASLFAIALSWALPTGQWLESFQSWVRGMGVTGAIIYALAYILCTVLFVPGLILTIGAGVLYGPWTGTLIVSISSVIGASLAFLIGRYFARSQVENWIRNSPRFSSIDSAIEKKGGWIVFLLRLSPIFPFNLLNYGLGLTGVRFPAYLIASWIGMLPGTFAYVLAGHAGNQALTGNQQLVYWIVAALATLIVTFVITRIAARAIRDASS